MNQEDIILLNMQTIMEMIMNIWSAPTMTMTAKLAANTITSSYSGVAHAFAVDDEVAADVESVYGEFWASTLRFSTNGNKADEKIKITAPTRVQAFRIGTGAANGGDVDFFRLTFDKAEYIQGDNTLSSTGRLPSSFEALGSEINVWMDAGSKIHGRQQSTGAVDTNLSFIGAREPRRATRLGGGQRLLLQR